MKHRTLRDLRTSLERALEIAAASTVALGCSSDPGPGLEREAGFLPMTCEDEAQIWLASLTPATAVDGMELLGKSYSVDSSREDLRLESLGTLCSGASDTAACEQTLDALDLTVGFELGACRDYECSALLVATRESDVLVMTSLEEVTEFLEPIESAGDARFLVQASGFEVLCDNGGAIAKEKSFVVQAFKHVGCDGLDRFTLSVTRKGEVTELSRDTIEEADPNCTVGRRPDGLRWCARPTRGIGGYLSRAAAMEGASVIAFQRLASELEQHGAPRSLVRSARAAARDEVRHARVMARHAQRFGGAPQPTEVAPPSPRSLEAIALENATEGCVRETFGVLVGQWQSEHARDGRLQRSYRRITRDELRHAALSWRVARWLDTRLTAAERERVAQEQQAAVLALGSELQHEPHPEVAQWAGVPHAAVARSLFDALRAELWSAAA